MIARRLRAAARGGVAWLALAGAVATAADEPNGPAEAGAATRFEGVRLGEFYYRNLRASDGVQVRLSFVLHAAVAEERLDDVERLVEARRHRLRDAVLIAVRLCPLRDFNEPELERFRRRVLLRLRRVEPRLALDALYVSEFAFFNE